MYAYSLQAFRPALPVFVHPHEVAALARAVRTAARAGAGIAAATGFAAVMWLLLAGPGFLDGRSSTVDHGVTRGAVRQAAR